MDTIEHLSGNNTLIVSFGGYAHLVGGIQPYEFLNFLKTNFPDTDQIYFKDSYSSSYHRGIKGISKCIDSTVEYIKTKIKGYSQVLFLGNSGGGYAALLFGSLLNVSDVLAFMPPTMLFRDDKDPRYANIVPLINSTTKYHVYGDLSVTDFKDYHHIQHCNVLTQFSNVTVIKKKSLNLKGLRDSGELKEILTGILNLKE